MNINSHELQRSTIAGIVAVIFGLLATFVVDIFVPTANLTWSLIAVGFASFFAGFAGYLGAMRRETLNI